MVFSAQTIKSCNFSVFKENTEEEITYNDKSFFIKTLDYLADNNKQMNYLITDLFSKDNIQEEFTDLLCNIIQDFLDILNKILDDFNSFIVELSSKKNEIKSNLYCPDIDIYYPEDRYEYTNLGTSTSRTTFKNSIETELGNLLLNLTKNTLEEEIEDNSNYFYDIQGKILGSEDPISKEDFPNRLYNFYRGEISDYNITSDEIKQIYTNYSNFDKNIKMIQKDKSDMEQSALNIQKYIMSLKIEKYIKNPEVTNQIFEKEIGRIKFICDTYLLVFSAKLDAVKDLYSQYENILINTNRIIDEEE